ncbi:cytochrome b5-like heme/steroid binding domain-containing protein [Protomyces lactucae-debilis]|uniref:Cytochrome b5-like heme/steroid binding domain-containing protein n=1 Tax=Protomyces lactucae-debilis TaxID=2754530 RepID=A0A1Y2F1N6_PROLT|nr:cytochrome b5-like heme/steroid binding domain-containing protein [Protomyces lactucae-debilis]ORY77788.1 cytochrome b5-like heme/steroid binding domain-containing protein [Protomyces lactucae-debilis]
MSGKADASRRPSKTASTGSGFSLLKAAAIGVMLALGVSRYRHGDYKYGYSNQYTNVNAWLQMLKPDIVITEAELAASDGTNGKPIYVAVNGTVYDVSAEPRLYGPGGSYSFFTGKDGARAYITGCFATDMTHDLRGVPEESLIELDAWKKFYETHGKYYRVGTVIHPPIDPSIPPPAPCDAQKMPSS